MDQGKIVEDGSSADLLARGTLYHRMYTRQFGAVRRPTRSIIDRAPRVFGA